VAGEGICLKEQQTALTASTKTAHCSPLLLPPKSSELKSKNV
jgi:hypothetical protein